MLKKLAHYREFILILVLFFGGIAWIYESFVTRTEMTREHCHLSLNIAILSYQLRGKLLFDEIILLNGEITDLRHETDSGAIGRLHYKESKRGIYTKRLEETRFKEEDLSDKLHSGECVSVDRSSQ